MAGDATSNGHGPVRIGVVSYLNSRPLMFGLERLSGAEIVLDLPSRLADALAAGRLDVALVPSIEGFRHAGFHVVSDACVACEGPVRSVKLYSRVPVEQIVTLALDEGSRTSAALGEILLRERFGLSPQKRLLPIGAAWEDTPADAAVLVGDRGLQPCSGSYAFVWDLGEEWSRWTGLPFVFAMWIARPGIEDGRLGAALSAARDQGVTRFEEIARREAPSLNLPEAECLAYLRDHLEFRLGERQRQGLALFYQLAQRHGLAPPGVDIVFSNRKAPR